MPTQILHGDRDHPEIAELLARSIPGARRESVAGADHYLPLRTPRPFAALLRAHLLDAGSLLG